jgi:4-carboxymuconolactone decarboxylase
MLITSREWTQQFEWAVHVPLAIKAGLKSEIVKALADGRRPSSMSEDEEIVYDFCDELFRTHGVGDTTYQRAVQKFGEQGVIDMLGVLGYFTALSTVAPLAPFPL